MITDTQIEYYMQTGEHGEWVEEHRRGMDWTEFEEQHFDTIVRMAEEYYAEGKGEDNDF